ncbi:helix-turn-helix transcriptional regulator [Gluconacetobacter sp. Hr-1-5]|uniref:helix-turn-helix transcriptional regulator n=1 Tax=Gluconacetobacter sp. Hr-1-5 TaxID=3395370 RepID=UPI003B51E68A
MLEDALLLDAGGNPLVQKHNPHSSDWEEVSAFCRQVYMPYRTRPLVRTLMPDATMYSVETGGIVATRFSYGVPVHLSDFDPKAGRVLVLTTLRGSIEHAAGRGESLFTGPGESFVADCSRTEYWLKASADHLQFNLTIGHDMLAATAQQWFGFLPNDALWTTKVRFGDRDSSWIALLDYVTRTLGRTARPGTGERIRARIAETVCVELLQHWADSAGIDLNRTSACAAPFYVRRAEDFMRENAAALPTMTDVAMAAGVSVRALSGAFRRYRDTTPSAFLREQRLLGTRAELLAAGPGETVGAIASRWGYVNFSEFAQGFLRRFNELPSATLARAHHALKRAAA